MVEQQDQQQQSESSSPSSRRDESPNITGNVNSSSSAGSDMPSPRVVGNELLLPTPNGTLRIQLNNRNVQPGVRTPHHQDPSSPPPSAQQQQQQEGASTSNGNQNPHFQTIQIQVPNQPQSINAANGTTISNDGRTFRVQINRNVNNNNHNDTAPGPSAGSNNSSERRQETNQADPNRSETANANRPRAFLHQAIPGRIRQGFPGRMPFHGRRLVQPPNRSVVNLPPLVPQPLPLANQPTITDDSNSSSSSSEANNGERNDNSNHHQQFDCPICYEIMEDPAGCGKCSNRFCYKCIVQVGRQQNSKCPCCRCELRLSNITRDGDLQRQIQSAETTSCNFCGQARLKLQELKMHEDICPAINVRCRYSSFGCAWTGPRKDLESHEKQCPLHNVQGLVSQLRVQQQLVTQLQQVANNSNQMIELHSQNLARVQSNKSPGHLLHMLELAYVATCIPARYIADRSTSWTHFERSREGKAAVHNFFTFMPTAILCMRIFVNAIDQMFELEHAKNSDHLLDLTLDLLLSYSITMLGVVAISCCFVESQSSWEWQCHERWSRMLGKPHPVIRDMVAISLLTVYFSVMDLLGGGKNAIIIWMFCLLTSVFFPAVVLTVVGSSDLNFVSIYHRTPTRIMKAGRAFPVVTFGLRYGFLANLVGASSCLDAIILYRLCLHYKILKRDYVLGMDCFISDVTNSNFWLSLCGFRISVMFGLAHFENGNLSLNNLMLPILISVVSLIVLIVMDRAISELAELGVTIGKTIHQAGRNGLGPRNEPPPGREYNQTGMLVFGIWCASISVVALAR